MHVHVSVFVPVSVCVHERTRAYVSVSLCTRVPVLVYVCTCPCTCAPRLPFPGKTCRKMHMDPSARFTQETLVFKTPEFPALRWPVL